MAPVARRGAAMTAVAMRENRPAAGSGAETARLDGLTGLRAVAAIWVLAFHYSVGPLSPLGTKGAVPFVAVGYLGVDLFFILSGFVIWHVHGQELAQPRLRDFSRFLCLRLARLYPVSLFALLLLAALVVLRPQWGDPPLNPASYTQRGFLLQLALVQSWGFTDHLAWNYPSWSVSAEWFCYLMFPALALIMARTGRRGTIIAVGLMLLTICVSYETVFNASLDQAVGGGSLLRAAPEFFLGCLLRRLTRQVDLRHWPWTAILAGLGGLWGVSFFTALPVELMAIPLFAGLIVAVTVSDGVLPSVLRMRPVVTVGAASYSLYMMQAPVQKAAHILQQWLSPTHPWRDAVIVAAYFMLLVGGTIFVHRFVENPSRRWLRTRIDHWLPRQAAPRSPHRLPQVATHSHQG